MVEKKSLLVFGVLVLSLFLIGIASACHCGDGNIDTPNNQGFNEECDLGELNGNLCWANYGSSCTYCSSTCELKTITNYCGDGIKQSCEECDYNALLGTAGYNENCNENCEIEEPQPYCGDGKVDFGEECDDGDYINGDGCSSTCEIESCSDIDDDSVCDEIDNCVDVYNPLQGDLDFDGIGDVCDSPECGNSYLELGEQCDYNALPGTEGYDENCNQNCEIEECPPEPSCGDGIVNQASEECDGESNCTNECKWEEEEEDCDDCCGKKEFVVLSSCQPNWECSGWTACVNGIMTRECSDLNNCEIELNKPLEKTGCENLSKVYVEKDGNYIWVLIGIIIFLILLIILINLIK